MSKKESCMKDKTRPMTSKKYQNIDAEPIVNFPEVWKWFFKVQNNILSSKKNILAEFNRNCNLLKDNRKAFLKLFGSKHRFIFQGEFKFHCWAIEYYPGEILILLTANEKGTCYEVVCSSSKEKVTTSKIIEFLEVLANKV